MITENPTKESKNLWVLWIGVALAAAVLTYTPRQMGTGSWRSYGWRFATNPEGQVNVNLVFLELLVVALVTGASFITLRNYKPVVANRITKRGALAIACAGCICAVVGLGAAFIVSGVNERAQTAAIKAIVVDSVEWSPQYDEAPSRVAMHLYNPTESAIHHDGIFHLRVHDPILNSDFDRRFRQRLDIDPLSPSKMIVNVELPFDKSLRPEVTVELPNTVSSNLPSVGKGSGVTTSGTKSTSPWVPPPPGDIFDRIAPNSTKSTTPWVPPPGDSILQRDAANNSAKSMADYYTSIRRIWSPASGIPPPPGWSPVGLISVAITRSHNKGGSTIRTISFDLDLVRYECDWSKPSDPTSDDWKSLTAYLRSKPAHTEAFAHSVRAVYPEYSDMKDDVLAAKLYAKYPDIFTDLKGYSQKSGRNATANTHSP